MNKFNPGDVVAYSISLGRGYVPWIHLQHYYVIRPTGPQHKSYIVKPLVHGDKKQKRLSATAGLVTEEQLTRMIQDCKNQHLVELLQKG